ncbi:hypothetical protein A3755_10235 [Oleiphilus sp. HI0085]|nr:hypothetical protein A3755_10235 [Oleiphilus sp. HI0085]
MLGRVTQLIYERLQVRKRCDHDINTLYFELSPRLKRMKDSGRYKEISGELFFDFDSEYKQQ